MPFDILEPVLERCTPEQLYRIEQSNQVTPRETERKPKSSGWSETDTVVFPLPVFHRGLGRAVDASLPAGLQARVSPGVRVVAGAVPAAARRARGATEAAHAKHYLSARQQAQRWGSGAGRRFRRKGFRVPSLTTASVSLRRAAGEDGLRELGGQATARRPPPPGEVRHHERFLRSGFHLSCDSHQVSVTRSTSSRCEVTHRHFALLRVFSRPPEYGRPLRTITANPVAPSRLRTTLLPARSAPQHQAEAWQRGPEVTSPGTSRRLKVSKKQRFEV